jgi:hypothetical protein
MPRRKRNQFEIPGVKLPDLGKLGKKLPKIKLGGLQNIGRQLVVVVGVGVLILVMLNLNSRLGEYYRLSSERDTIETKVAELSSTHVALQTQVAYAQSDQAAEDYARDAHMIREGEKLVVPLTPVGNPTPTPEVAEETPPPPLNWEVWWTLFFAK